MYYLILDAHKKKKMEMVVSETLFLAFVGERNILRVVAVSFARSPDERRFNIPNDSSL